MRDSGQPQSRFAEWLRKIGVSFLKLFRGDFLVFLLFLAITFFFWWSQTMNQNYDTSMKVPVQLTGIPDDIRVTSPPVSQISVSLSGKGAALRKSGRIGGRHVLMIDGSTFLMNQGHASLSTQSLRDSISALIPSSVIIRSVEPDSLTYQYARQRTVMLPVEFGGSTESQDQFFLERIEFTPDSVQARILLSDTLLHSITVDAGTITLSSDTVVKTVALKPVPDVLFSTDDVRMTVIAQQYTEKSIEVPVLGVNFPEYLTLKSFPSKAVVTVWVKMSEYDRVGPEDFQIVVDYNDIAGRDVSKAPLHIYSQPANVRNVRLQTRTVDFLMESVFF
jgi:hypothetical protein